MENNEPFDCIFCKDEYNSDNCRELFHLENNILPMNQTLSILFDSLVNYDKGYSSLYL